MPAPLKTRALIFGTVAAGAAIVAVAAVQAASASPTTVALLAVAVVVTELLQVPSDKGSLDPVDAHTVGFSSGIHLAAILLVGPWAAALVAVFGVFAVDRLRGTAWRYIVFNAGVFAVATAVAGLVYRVAGGEVGSLSLPSALPAIVALVVSYSLVNMALVSGVVAFEGQMPFWPYFRDSIRHELHAKAAEAGIAVAVATFALREPWALVALVPLCLAVYQAHARLALLRRETGRALETFANVVDERDPYTYRHSARVAEYVASLASALRFPGASVSRLRWAGRLHDLGKIAVDPATINRPGALRDTEWEMIYRHPRLSARLLRRFRFAAEEARAVEYHHERFDGNGYYGVDASTTPLAAHFLIVADSFDAMTSDRPYRRGLSVEAALAEIEAKAGEQFHPTIARAFVAQQRGLDPLEAVSAAEHDELLRAIASPRTERRDRPAWAGRAEVAALAGLVLTLLGATFWGLAGAALPACVLLAALAVRQRSFVRAQTLAHSLRAQLRSSGRPDLAFHGLASRLAGEGDLAWAGLVRWSREELTGTVERSWGDGAAAPADASLTSWLLREADSESDDPLLVASGSELGLRGTVAAVRLQHDRSRTTVILLAFASRLPRHVDIVLRTLRAELEPALQPLLREAPSPERAVAVS